MLHSLSQFRSAKTYEAGPVLSEAALAILRERYLKHDETGRTTEDPNGMFRRVASAAAAPAGAFGEDIGFWEDRFHKRLQRLEFLPNSPTLMNAGLSGGQLAACFVLPIEDDLDSIFTTLKSMARIHQTGGGTGFDFSALRPRSDPVRSTGGISSGPLSFMDLFDRTTAVIRQGGRRRGANMAVLRVDHPDIEEFISAKGTLGKLENFNLSVGVPDTFFQSLESRESYPLRNPRTGRIDRYVDPQKILEAISEAAWATGDPGLLFLDEINRHNPTPKLGSIEATNPCGEQPLLPYESCTLGSINLAAFCLKGRVDWERLRPAIRDAIVFLDNVIDANCYLLPEIEAATRRSRKVGLGVMGFADLLALLAIPYDSDEGLELGARIAQFLTSEARAASIMLGERRGSFPAFPESIWPERGVSSLRNATVTCIAPTGTISMIAGCSSSIEPFFALASKRRVLNNRVFTEVNPLAAEVLASLGTVGKTALEHVEDGGTLASVADLPEAVKRRFPTALEITPRDHVRMQAAFQRHMDAGVSKTANLPTTATPDAVKKVFLLARRLNLKGITVYRYGSRPAQPLSLVHEDARHDCRECAV